MSDLVALPLLLLGVAFMLLSAVGVVRMPDLYMRLQVASKASSLGAGCLMLAVAIHFWELGIVVRAMLVVAFIFLTTPVSAHLIGRAAYLSGVPLWERSGRDELRGAYDPDRGTLGRPVQSDDPDAPEAQPPDPDAPEAQPPGLDAPEAQRPRSPRT